MPSFGWKGKEPEDLRDHIYQLQTAKLALVPKTTDLRPKMPPIRNQGEQGSCTAFAGEAVPGYLSIKNKKPVFIRSPRHLYWWERFILGLTDEDSGAYIRNIPQALKKYGISSEELCPYRDWEYIAKPSDAANKFALDHQIIKYERVAQSKEAIMQCVGVDKLPVLFGFNVPPSFMTVKKSGTWTPRSTEKSVGGHAQVIVGYTATRVIIRNSWGIDDANKGYRTVPWWFILDPQWCDDFWCIYTGELM